MNHLAKKLVKVFIGFLIIVIILILAGYFAAPENNNPVWGINFSPKHARSLGFEPTDLFRAMVTDLNVKHVRIPLYWDDFETEPNSYNFVEIGNLLDLAEENHVEVILAVGRKLPRWPECHEPAFVKTLSKEQQEDALLGQIIVAVRTLESSKSIVAWQVENEAFFDYGENCPVLSKDLYKKELATVRKWDSFHRPIIGTDSGEKGPWLPTAWTGIDIFGSTMYRQVYLDKKGYYTTYPLPAWTYRVKAGWLRMFSGANQTYGVELQAEPWFAGTGPVQTPYEEHKRLMNSEILQQNIEYAKKSGFSQHYFWGAEWWYWLSKTYNDDSLIETVKPLFRTN